MWNLSSRLTQHASHTTAAVVLALGLCSLGSVAQAQSRDPVFGGVVGAGAGALIGNAIGGRDGAVIGAMIGGVAGANMGIQMHPSRPVYYDYPAYPRQYTREVVYMRPVPPPRWQEPRWERRDDRYQDWRGERNDRYDERRGHGYRHGHD
jgi:hypothetical protein